jgi:hypothetical protein
MEITVSQVIRESEHQVVVDRVTFCRREYEAVVRWLNDGRDVTLPSFVSFGSPPFDSVPVREISRLAFADSALRSIKIPRTVEILCSRCESLSSISFESNYKLRRIEWGVFSNCSSLTSFMIPRSIGILCHGCFSDCESLSSISFESNCKL